MSCLGIIYEFVSGSCNPIRMDIFEIREKIHGIRVSWSGEAYSGNIFASYFLWKI